MINFPVVACLKSNSKTILCVVLATLISALVIPLSCHGFWLVIAYVSIWPLKLYSSRQLTPHRGMNVRTYCM